MLAASPFARRRVGTGEQDRCRFHNGVDRRGLKPPSQAACIAQLTTARSHRGRAQLCRIWHSGLSLLYMSTAPAQTSPLAVAGGLPHVRAFRSGTIRALRPSEGTMSTRACRSAVYVLLVTVASVLLAACGTRTEPSTPSSPPTGVVTGRVTAGPTCPLERAGSPCPERPVVAEVQAQAAGQMIASTRSGTDGTYRLELPDGTYTVVAITPDVLPCADRTVTVADTQTTIADISCDTGIR